jgi:hypothetical protein
MHHHGQPITYTGNYGGGPSGHVGAPGGGYALGLDRDAYVRMGIPRCASGFPLESPLHRNFHQGRTPAPHHSSVLGCSGRRMTSPSKLSGPNYCPGGGGSSTVSLAVATSAMPQRRRAKSSPACNAAHPNSQPLVSLKDGCAKTLPPPRSFADHSPASHRAGGSSSGTHAERRPRADGSAEAWVGTNRHNSDPTVHPRGNDSPTGLRWEAGSGSGGGGSHGGGGGASRRGSARRLSSEKESCERRESSGVQCSRRPSSRDAPEGPCGSGRCSPTPPTRSRCVSYHGPHNNACAPLSTPYILALFSLWRVSTVCGIGLARGRRHRRRSGDASRGCLA